MNAASCAVVFACLTFAVPARAITFGQVDDFQDGTLQNWANGGVGGAPPPTNVPSGGPAGANDNFLRIASDSAGAGNRLTIFNRSQWLGNYIAAGVTAIEVDLENLGPTELSIRLAFKGSLTMSAPAYLTAPAILPSGSGWQHFTFSLAPADLIPVLGPPSYSTVFGGGLAEVRFINEVAANNSNGDIITAQLGIDNIRAVPEPQVIYSLGTGTILLALIAARRFRLAK